LSNNLQNKSRKCPNCGQALNHEENFCPNCGQKNTDLNISFWEIIKEFLGDFFSFDDKLFKTVPALLFKPGKVPKEYIDGKRAGHIPPLRIFIFLSFVTFFLWSLSFSKNDVENEENNIADVLLDSLDANPEIKDSLKTEFSKIDTVINGVNFSVDTAKGKEVGLDLDEGDIRYMLDKTYGPEQIVDSLAPDFTGFKRHAFIQSLRVYQAKKGEFLKYLMGNISLVLLLLQPFFALFLKLFYIRRKEFFYIEHLVFSLYYHSFILLLTIFLYVVHYIFGSDYLILILVLSAFIYLILALKRFYGQSIAKTIFKAFLISGAYITFLIPSFAIGYLLLGLYFY